MRAFESELRAVLKGQIQTLETKYHQQSFQHPEQISAKLKQIIDEISIKGQISAYSQILNLLDSLTEDRRREQASADVIIFAMVIKDPSCPYSEAAMAFLFNDCLIKLKDISQTQNGHPKLLKRSLSYITYRSASVLNENSRNDALKQFETWERRYIGQVPQDIKNLVYQYHDVMQ